MHESNQVRYYLKNILEDYHSANSYFTPIHPWSLICPFEISPEVFIFNYDIIYEDSTIKQRSRMFTVNTIIIPRKSIIHSFLTKKFIDY